jgi:polysaccharide biosynthesis protein PslH
MTAILFLVHRAPWPPDRGDRIRSWHLFEALRRLAPVHVAALADSEAEAASARAKLEPLAASVHIVVRRTSRAVAMASAVLRDQPASLPLFSSPELARHVGGLINHGPITHIVAFSSQMAQYIPDGCNLPFVMDFVDVDSAKFEAYAAADRPGVMRWVHAREGRLLGAYEASVARAAENSLFVSEAEAALFRARTGLDGTRVRALENGIDLTRFSPDSDWQPLSDAERGTGPLAVFTGQMDYRPNMEAVTDFALYTLPLIRAVHPTARFAIVGRAPTSEVRALADRPGVVVTGEVPDTRPWLAAADAVVAPLAVARGVQNKLLEAMAMARPVVASSSAAQGIDAMVGEHLLVADGPGATAEAVSALIDDPARGEAIGTAARTRMQARYGWDATLAPMASILPLGGGGTRSVTEGPVRPSATLSNDAPAPPSLRATSPEGEEA